MSSLADQFLPANVNLSQVAGEMTSASANGEQPAAANPTSASESNSPREPPKEPCGSPDSVGQAAELENRLTAPHLNDLRNSGLSDEQIIRCRFRSVRERDIVQRCLRWKNYKGELGDCLAIPFFDRDGNKIKGYCRLKPDRPRLDKNGKPIKYESPFESTNRAYFPPGTLAALNDPLAPLVTTEGEKKSAKADQEGFPCVGLVGVYGWQKKRIKDNNGKSQGERELIDDLAGINWQERQVFITFDSDMVVKPDVLWAEWYLAQTLTKAGAIVKIVRLPQGDKGPDGKPAKVGLDDYLVAHGKEALQKLLDGAGDPIHPNKAAEAEAKKRAEEEKTRLASLVELANTNSQKAIDQAIQQPTISILAGLIETAPGALESFFRQLQNSGAKSRELTGLRAAIKNESKRLQKERARSAKAIKTKACPDTDKDGKIISFSNFFGQQVEGKDAIEEIGYSIHFLKDRLLRLAAGFPRRMGNLLFGISGHEPVWIAKPNELFAWINAQLPGNLDFGKGPVNMLNWNVKVQNAVSESRFFAHLQQTVENYDAVECFPHQPQMDRIFYLHPVPQGGDGKALKELMDRFNPATLVDHDLILAFLLTLLWGGRPGQRPAFLFTAEEGEAEGGRGVGKTTLAEIGAYLVGGAMTFEQNEKRTDITVRLLSKEGLTKRVALVDNIKSLKFSWADLESFVTSTTISGRQHYVGEGRRPNTLVWCLTLNGATLSKDMASRIVIVKLKRPTYDPTWKEKTLAFIDERRWEIVGDLLAILGSATKPLVRHSRWGSWEDAVLCKVGDPAECQKVIEERQDEVDNDASEADLIRDAFIEEMTSRGHDPQKEVVWIPSKDAAEIVNEGTGEKLPKGKANAYLLTVLGAIHELKKSDRGIGRGWTWTGQDADPFLSARRIQPKRMKATCP